MALHEIVLAETEPETEWVRGRALQKVSPTYSHGALQAQLVMVLRTWARAGRHGRVASEWRFRVAPPGAMVRPLVPDVAFVSYADLAEDAPPDAVETPLGAPTVAFEILSRGDRRVDVAHKVSTYLLAGSTAVVVVDGRRSSLLVHDAGGVADLHRGDVLSHPVLPGFALDVATFFDEAAS